VAVAAGEQRSLGIKTVTVGGIDDLDPTADLVVPMLDIRSVEPNPFFGPTTVSFAAKEPVQARLEVYDVMGRQISQVDLGGLEPGLHRSKWNGRNSSGELVPSGVYFIQLRSSKGVSRPAKAIAVR
jgi:hypothetical protein